MSLELDHVVIAVADLETAIQDYQELGFTVIEGGIHKNRLTKNALIVFGNGTYIELLAATGEKAVSSQTEYSQLLEHGEGLVAFALRTENIENELERLDKTKLRVDKTSIVTFQRGAYQLQWKQSLVNKKFLPFLIEDLSPRDWRIPTDKAFTEHSNRAIGLKAVEFVVRDIEAAWEYYTTLLGIKPHQLARNYRDLGAIVLNEYLGLMDQVLKTLPNIFPAFGGMSAQSDSGEGDTGQEPQFVNIMKQVQSDMFANMTRQSERENAMMLALGDKSETLFAVHLLREEVDNSRFILERTHGVQFQHFTGVAKTQGMDVLLGLDTVDWNKFFRDSGEGTTVPDLLRALTSENADVRSRSHQILADMLNYQGIIAEGAIETIPFLMQIIDASHLNHNAAISSLNEVTFGGIDTPEFSEQTKHILADTLPMFIRHLESSDEALRLNAVQHLSLYSYRLEQMESLLKIRIEQDESSKVQASALASLASLWLDDENRAEKQLTEEQSGYIARQMLTTQSLALQFEAALILVRDNPDFWLEKTSKLFSDLLAMDSLILKEEFGLQTMAVFFAIDSAFAKMPKVALQWLIQQASNPNGNIRQYVAPALSRLEATGQEVEAMLPTLQTLMRDPSPDVRQSAIMFFANSPHKHLVKDTLEDIAKHDISVSIRQIAGNILKTLGS